MQRLIYVARLSQAEHLVLRDGVQPTAEGGQNIVFSDFGVGVGANEKQSQSAG